MLSKLACSDAGVGPVQASSLVKLPTNLVSEDDEDVESGKV